MTKYATSTVSRMFNNPFYAGWLVSEGYEIGYGQLRGKWEPIITTEEYEQGFAILARPAARAATFRVT